MKLWLVLLVACVACTHDRSRPPPDPKAAVAALRDTLIRVRAEDQAGRDSIALAIAHNDSAFIRRLVHGDSARTQWLREVVSAHGWPRRSMVGDTAAEAAFLIVQHSSIDFQQQMLPILEGEAKHGEINAANVAMLSDRVRVKKGQPQRYGTQFDVKDNRLVPDSMTDITTVDSLRASVGLTPMAEYVKLLASMYRIPVEWPPHSPTRH